jgi:hypothetical protein
MDKVNFKKDLAELYNPKNTEWELVEVPAMIFLMADGKGDPNTSQDYSDAPRGALQHCLRHQAHEQENAGPRLCRPAAGRLVVIR